MAMATIVPIVGISPTWGNRPGRPAEGGRGPGSGGPAVAEHRPGRQHDQHPHGPGQGGGHLAGGGSTQHEGAGGVDDVAHRLVAGEGLQPAGHGGDGDEGRRGEGEGEDRRERHDLGRLAVRSRQPDDGEAPRHGEGPQHQHAHGTEEAEGAGGAEPDGEADGGHDDDDEQVAAHVGHRAARQHRRACHRQGTEALDQTLVQVLGQAHAGAHRAEGDGLHEDAGHHVVDVVEAGDLDGPAEHVAEQQHEHDRLHRQEEQRLRRSGVADQVALGDGQSVDQGPHHAAAPPGRPQRRQGDGGGRAHDTSSALRPVRARNTSSRLGSRSERWAGTRAACSRAVRARLTKRAPSSTLTSTARPCTTGGCSVRRDRTSEAFWASASSAISRSSTVAPIRALSWAGVPSAITLPWSTTATCWASRSASSRYWVVSSTVVPSLTSSSMVCHRSLRLWGSSPVVGSSRKSTGGRATSEAATSRRRRWPPEYVLAGRLATSSSWKRAISCSPRRTASRRPTWLSWPIRRRFSRAVSRSSTAAFCPAKPMLARTASASVATSRPSTRARPLSGRSTVVNTRTAVVLPAPLGPSRPSTVPASTSRLSPSRARTACPNTFTRSAASIA